MADLYSLKVKDNLNVPFFESKNERTYIKGVGGYDGTNPTEGVNDIKTVLDSSISIGPLTEITYSELKSKRDNSELTPGMQYRITDYVTKTKKDNVAIAASGYTSAHHAFDLVVTADDVNVLNENARAMLHDGDTYFASQNLEAWQVQYCIDNDTDRFDWVDNTCMGAIYHMVDETGHDFPYDFKNIMFVRKLTDGQLDETSGTLTWVYSLNLWSGNTCNDNSLTIADNFAGPCCEKAYVHVPAGSFLKWNKRILNDGVCLDGINYPYYCGYWTCDYNCNHWTCGYGCEGWQCGYLCEGWTVGGRCFRWNCGDYCSSWKCGLLCSYWKCGHGCTTWSCGNYCSYWECENNCCYWSVLNYCQCWKACNTSCGWQLNKSYCERFTIDIRYPHGAAGVITHSGTTSSSSMLRNFTILNGTISGNDTLPLMCPLNYDKTWIVSCDDSGMPVQYNLYGR